MKKTVTPLRSLCAALAALMLLLALAVPAFAADGFADLYYRVNDSAEVLTEDEDGVKDDTDYTPVYIVVTVNEAQAKTLIALEKAENFHLTLTKAGG